jgi:hypothetical protein
MSEPVPHPSDYTVECADERCSTETTADNLPGDWQASNDPNEPVLCPECAMQAPNDRITPTEARRKFNHELTEFENGR